MTHDLTPSDYLALIIFGILIGGSLLVGGIRAVWLYGRPPWLRNALLGLSTAGVGAALLGWRIHGAPGWLLPLGAVVAVGPVSLWLLARWISYTGPPPGLVRGPRSLEQADNLIDSFGRAAGLDDKDSEEKPKP